MSKPTYPEAEELAQIAKAATDHVRAQAAAKGEKLPIWQEGRVVYVDPADVKPATQPTPTASAAVGSKREIA